MMSGYSFFLTSTVSVLGVATISRRTSATAAAQNSKLNRAAKKGSFLLKTPGVKSEAARIVAEKNCGLNDKASPSRNEQLGKSLISLRDKQMGPNVAVFYKQVNSCDI